MKTTIKVILVLAVAIAAFGFVNAANAQAPTPVYPGNGGSGRGGSGIPGTGTGNPVEQNINLDGLLDDLMANYIADALNISVDDLKVREAAGESLVEIGLSLGFDAETILDLHDQARIFALNEAVAQGLITQEQADWMLSRIDFGQYGDSSGLCVDDCTETSLQTTQKFQQGLSRGRSSIKP
jgi:hypothetical protein